MRAVDKAGNIREATNKDTSVVVNTVVDSNTKIGISYSTTAATKGNVNVTFTDNSGVSGLTLKYQIGSTTGTWTKYTGPVSMTANGKIYARLFDSKNQYTNTATGTVQNIDKLAPTTATIASSKIEQTTFTLTATGVDATATSTNAKSGIAKYEFYINNKLEKTVTSTAGTATLNVTGKTAETTYTCKVRVYDKAGNYKDSTTVTVTTKSAGVDIGDMGPEVNGKYVNYSANGYDKWRILTNDANGVTLISDGSVENLTLSGMDGYNNALPRLQNVADKYNDNNFCQSVRSVKKEDFSVLLQNNMNFSSNSNGVDSYWMAGRTKIDGNYGVYMGLVLCYGKTTEHYKKDQCLGDVYNYTIENDLYDVVWMNGDTPEIVVRKTKEVPLAGLLGASDGSSTTTVTLGVRPVVTLKPGVKISGGTGTASDPYQLSF